MEHAGQGPAWALALQESGLGLFIRNSLWIYPLANLMHVLGVIGLVGPIVALDLRLLGFVRKIPIELASRLLTPLAVGGILLLVPGGLGLFIADAASMAANPVMQVKLSLIALGLANAIAFRLLWGGERLRDWDRTAPPFGRAQAAASIAIWLTVPVLGRLVAYL